MLIGALLVGGFWAVVLLLSLRGRTLPLSVAALMLTALLLGALAPQPHVHTAGWAALVLTVAVVAAMYAAPGGGDADGD